MHRLCIRFPAANLAWCFAGRPQLEDEARLFKLVARFTQSEG